MADKKETVASPRGVISLSTGMLKKFKGAKESYADSMGWKSASADKFIAALLKSWETKQ